MTEYHKIQSVWMRDSKGKFTDDFATPEIRLLSGMEWLWHEKIDGTNVRIIIDPNHGIGFRGKAERSLLSVPLTKALDRLFPEAMLRSHFPDGAVLYGEGIGPKIQGGLYKGDWDFVLFDVRVGGLWLEQSTVVDVAKAMELSRAQVVGTGKLWEAELHVQSGFKSLLNSETKAEGLVLRPMGEFLDRQGNRIITKLKAKDYPSPKNKES